MKNIITLLIFTMILSSHAQELDAASFDFWVGEWELQWDKGDGTTGHGTNTIVKILDGKVIQENFTDPGTGFKGMSLSVYNPTTKIWHQAWTDNAGGYFDFIGSVDGTHKIFSTKAVQQNEKTIIQRMVFKDVTHTSFVWDWEKTEDGGKHWKLQWKIQYTRKK